VTAWPGAFFSTQPVPVLSIQGRADVAGMMANLAWLLPVIYLLENPARKSQNYKSRVCF
jgi:hypothetical protein